MTGPNVATTGGMRKTRTQPDYRRSLNPLDQHDRPWLVSIELESGDPTGLIMPCGWDDPLRTPQKYIKSSLNQYGQRDWGRVFIDYVQWIKDLKADVAEWRRQVMTIAQGQYKGSVGPKEAFTHPYVLELAGAEPFPTVDLVEAARTGDREVLGLVPMSEETEALFGPYLNKGRTVREMTDDLKAELAEGSTEDVVMTFGFEEVTGTSKEDWTRFLEIGKQAKMPYPAILAAWREHKELMQDEQANQET